MKRIVCLVAMLGLAAVGCGNNECEDAVDKLEECDIPTSDVDEDEVSECNSQSECEAKCINEASCADITSLADWFVACASACGG